MALPNPLPDNPLRWDGWRKYNSPNAYERLCLDYSSNAGADIIEDHCRQLLVWWQKKLPLKNQPSNPMAQLLRQGLDEAPQFLAEARTILLDTEQRRRLDAELHAQIIAVAMEEFKKLLSFALADQKFSPDSEDKLYVAGERMGLGREEMKQTIESEIERTGSKRVTIAQPAAPPPAPIPEPASIPIHAPIQGDPFAEFRRILQMSRLCQDGEEMSDDQRDAMCNLGESLGLTGGQAEDLIDEYLEEAAASPVQSGASAMARPVTAPQRTATAAPKPPAAAPKPAALPITRKDPVINLSPAARAAERLKYPNFMNSVGGQMLLVPTGQFTMGTDHPDSAPNEQPSGRVTVSAFYLGRFPVTNIQYEKFDSAHRSKRASWANDSHPVIYVSWNEAVAFCKWLSQTEGKKYRLPTEAEWEYAARGTDGRMFPWGNEFTSGKMANFADARTNLVWRDTSIDDGYAETAPVGVFPLGASPFGIEELSGNVHEWCNDWYAPYQGKERTNPPGPGGGQQRVLRGGSWRSRMASLRSVARSSNLSAFQSNDIGFRIVCECN
jgi:formylglycine-generating enzyme required for sulfatase activity